MSRAATIAAVLIMSVPHSFDSGAKEPKEELVKVEVATLALADEGRSVVLLLKPSENAAGMEAEKEKDARVLPLLIGIEEGRSIVVAFNKIQVPRPLSHDLMKTIVDRLEGSVDRCVITRMENETFYAELRLRRDGGDLNIDCRPSDAIALSLRTGTPIFVKRIVFELHSVDPGDSRRDPAVKT